MMESQSYDIDSLLAELAALRRRVAELEGCDAGPAAPACPDRHLEAQLLDAVGQAVIAADLDGRIISWNRLAEKLYGWPAEEARGQNIVDLFPAPAVLEQEPAIMASLRQGRDWSGEFRLERRDGRPVWVLATLSPLYDPAGEMTGVVAVALDIGAHKQIIEEAVRHSEQRFGEMVDALPQFVAYTDRNLTYRFVNQTYQEIFGVSAEKIVGRSLPEVIGEAAYERARPHVEKALSGQYVRYHEYLDYSDGKRRAIDGHLVPDVTDDGQVLGYYAILTDITPYQETETARQEQEQLFRDVFEQAAVGMALIDPEGRWLQVNQKLCDIFGYSRAELLALTVRDVAHPEDLAYGVAFARRALAGEFDSYSIELRGWRKTGTPIWLKLSAALTRRPSGEPDYFVAVLEDTTQYKQLEARLLQAQKMDAVGRLASGIAHDFNNLLVVIAGYTDMLLGEHADKNDPTGQDLRQIKRAADRAAELTRRLLAFSRQQVPQPRPLSLNHLITDSQKMLRRLIGENIRLITDLAPGLPPIKADPGHMEQVILNLAVNARDAMPRGGRLSLTTAAVDLELEQATPRLEPGPYVLLTIRDTGHGIDQEILPHIFEPFFTTKEPDRGTGLGLSIVYGLVRQAGGHVEVDSRPDRGAAFNIYLPQARPGDAEEQPTPEATGTLWGQETVLVLEDEADVRGLIKMVLSSYGYTVLEARTGREALSSYRQHPNPIHLLLADVILPGISGSQVAERILVARPGTKILFMSGYSANTLGSHGIWEMGIPFLQKPFTPNILAKKVREVLDG